MADSFNWQKNFKTPVDAWRFLARFAKTWSEAKVDLRLSGSNLSLTLQEDNPALVDWLSGKSRQQRDTIKLFCDGGSRGNPGPGASGFVLLDAADTEIERGGRFLDQCTNNQAEYDSLYLGVVAAIKHQPQNLIIYMDSQLIVKQIKKEYKVKDAKLKVTYEKVCDFLGEFNSYEIGHIPRKLNSVADSIVNQILDRHLK